MKNNIISISGFIVSIFFLNASGLAADFEKSYNPWPVVISGDTVGLPFLGGINSPKPQLVDFDGDDRPDLFLGKNDGRVLYLKNVNERLNQAGRPVPIFQPITERLGGVNTHSWFLLEDIDNDNDFDLFCDRPPSRVAFYENVSIGSALEFVLVDSTFGDFTCAYNSTPSFADLDSDGDKDFFFGSLSGALEFYRNVGDENNPSFVFENDFYDSILAITGGPAPASEDLHGYSNIHFVDVDSDADMDLFWGDIFNFNLYYFANLGDSIVSDLTPQTQDYLPFATRGFNHVTFADIDVDTDLDLVVGVGDLGADYNNLVLVRNIGVPSFPLWAAEDSNFVKQIDVGTGSVPAFGDLDHDGDFDLLLGGVNGQLAYFENKGTATEPSFEMITDFYESIDVGLNSSPVLADWDNDSDLDLLIGTLFGKIEYWRNDGSISSFEPVLVSSQLGGIKVDQLAVPTVADLNDDDLLDLIVGEWDFNSRANIRLYSNVGSVGNPDIDTSYVALLVDDIREFTVPRFYDWNDDGRLDLILAGRSSGLKLYQNSTASGSYPDSLTLLSQSDSLPGYDDGGYYMMAFVDIDNDGDDDVFGGEEDGGLNFWRRKGSCCIGFRGNSNGDPADETNISDITALVSYLFGIPSGEVPSCLPEANANGDPSGEVNISDITFLVKYLFGQPLGPAPPLCPPEN